MTYLDALKIRDALEAEARTSSAILRAAPKGPCGLTPDAARATPEWRAARAHNEAMHVKVRRFNQWFLATYKDEIAAARLAKYAVDPVTGARLAAPGRV